MSFEASRLPIHPSDVQYGMYTLYAFANGFNVELLSNIPVLSIVEDQNEFVIK